MDAFVYIPPKCCEPQRVIDQKTSEECNRYHNNSFVQIIISPELVEEIKKRKSEHFECRECEDTRRAIEVNNGIY